MADGSYLNLRSVSHIVVDEAAITLATTMKALWAPAITALPINYWYPGKVLEIEAFGKATTDGTAGNYVFEAGLGTGDAPAALAAGATVAGTVSQTNVTWRAKAFWECRTRGASGTFRFWGKWEPVVALLASTLQPYLFPNATPADITFDTTALGSPTFQAQRSGAGVWTMTTTNIILKEYN